MSILTPGPPSPRHTRHSNQESGDRAVNCILQVLGPQSKGGRGLEATYAIYIAPDYLTLQVISLQPKSVPPGFEGCPDKPTCLSACNIIPRGSLKA